MAEVEPAAAERLIGPDDLWARQTVVFPHLNGILLHWWVAHLEDCPANAGEECDCELVVWFSTPGRMLGVDGSLAVYESLVH